MNEWERRVLEVTQNHVDLITATQQMGARALIEYFGYCATIGSQAAPLLNGATRQAVIAVQADSWFHLQYVNCCVVPPLAIGAMYAMPAGNILLQITDTGAGEVLYSNASLGAILAGTLSGGSPGIPMLLPIPRLIPPNTNIKIEVTQLGVSAGNLEPWSFDIALLGARVAQL